MNYSIGIGINDLVSAPARGIQNALSQIQTLFAGLRGATIGNSASLEAVRNSLSGVSSTTTQTTARIQSLQAELSQMRDFRFTLDVNVDADLVREVEEEIRRLQGSISQLEANRVNVRTDTTQLETLNQRLASLRNDRTVAINTNVNASDLLALDIQINETEQELRRLSQPQNINIGGTGTVNQASQSIRDLTGAIRNEGNQARISQAQNQRFVTMLNGFPSSANASARSIDRLQAEIEQLTTRRNTLDINVNSRDVIRCNAEIRALQRQVTTAQGASNGGWFKNLFSGGALSFLGGNLMFTAVQGAISGLSAGVKGAMNLEQTKISFGTFSENKALGRAMKSKKPFDEKQVREQAKTEANGTVADLNKYADKTSFENPDILRVGAKMSGYLDQGEIVKKIKMFGDISGGDVGKLDSLELVYGQIKDAGKMQGQDLMQLINGGAFGIMEELAKVKNIDVSKVREAMKDGQISFQDVDKALTNMTTKGGNFYGVMDAQSQSTFGRLSTLIGGVKTKFYEAFIGADFPIFSQLINIGQAIFDNFSKISEPFGRLVQAFSPIGTALSNIYASLTGGASLTDTVSKSMSVLGGIVDLVADGVGTLAGSFEWLTTSMGGITTLLTTITGATMLFSETILTSLSAVKLSAITSFGVIKASAIASFEAISLAISANPIGAILIGIGLAVIGIKMLYDNCEGFREVVDDVFDGFVTGWNVIKIVWAGIKNVFSVSIAYLSEKVNAFVGFFTGIWDKITNPAKISFSSILDTVKNVFASILDFILNFNPITAGLKLGQKLGEAMKAGMSDGVKDIQLEQKNALEKQKSDRRQQEIKQGGGAMMMPDSHLKGVNNNAPFFLAPFQKNKMPNAPKVSKPTTVIPPPFSGGTGKKGKDIGDKSGINKTVEGSKPTVVNVTFGSVTGANYLTQNLSGNDTASKANEIVDLVVEQIIRRIGSSIAIAN